MIGDTGSFLNRSEDLEAEITNEHSSEWFQSQFQSFNDFMGISLKGLEVQTTKFLLAVEHMIQERADEAKKQKQGSKSGGKGIRELRALFSSINYCESSTKHRGISRDRALIVSQ